MLLNIIHLPERNFEIGSIPYQESLRRKESFESEMISQGIEYKVWDAILNINKPFAGCLQSHKMIVRDAKEKKLPMVAIAEDDIKFFSRGAWDYFIWNMPKDFDMYFGMSYTPVEYPNGKIDQMFDSLTLYIIKEKFYDVFLNLPEDNHADRTLSKMVDRYDFKIAEKFVCEQLNGYSFLAKKVRSYDHRLVNAPKFGVNS